jgi:hypothetical protein
MVLALIIWVIIKLIWWIVGATALVGLLFLGRAIVRWHAKRDAEYARYREGLAFSRRSAAQLGVVGRRPRDLRRRRGRTDALHLPGEGPDKEAQPAALADRLLLSRG